MTTTAKLLGIIVAISLLCAYYRCHYNCDATTAPKIRGSGQSNGAQSSFTTTTTAGGATITTEKRLLWRNETPLDDDYSNNAPTEEEEDPSSTDSNGNANGLFNIMYGNNNLSPNNNNIDEEEEDSSPILNGNGFFNGFRPGAGQQPGLGGRPAGIIAVAMGNSAANNDATANASTNGTAASSVSSRPVIPTVEPEPPAVTTRSPTDPPTVPPAPIARTTEAPSSDATATPPANDAPSTEQTTSPTTTDAADADAAADAAATTTNTPSNNTAEATEVSSSSTSDAADVDATANANADADADADAADSLFDVPNDEDVALQASLLDETGPVHDSDGSGLNECLWRVLTGSGCTADANGDVVQGHQHEYLVADGQCRYNDFVGYYRAGCQRPDPSLVLGSDARQEMLESDAPRQSSTLVLSEAFCTDPNCSTGCQTDAVIRTNAAYVSSFCYLSSYYENGSLDGVLGTTDDDSTFEVPTVGTASARQSSTNQQQRLDDYEFSFEFVGGCLETENCHLVDQTGSSLTRENNEEAVAAAAATEPTLEPSYYPTKASKATPSPSRNPTTSPTEGSSTYTSKASKAYYGY